MESQPQKPEFRNNSEKFHPCSLHAGIFFNDFLSFSDFFFSIFFLLKKSFRNTIRLSTSFDPVQARQFVRPYLGPYCLQRSSANDTHD